MDPAPQEVAPRHSTLHIVQRPNESGELVWVAVFEQQLDDVNMLPHPAAIDVRYDGESSDSSADSQSDEESEDSSVTSGYESQE